MQLDIDADALRRAAPDALRGRQFEHVRPLLLVDTAVGIGAAPEPHSVLASAALLAPLGALLGVALHRWLASLSASADAPAASSGKSKPRRKRD